MKKQKPVVRVAIIGGGSGMPPILQALILAAKWLGIELRIDAIASPCDSGGGTGDIREAWGIGPVGDIWRILMALSGLSWLRRWVITWFLSQRVNIHPFSQRDMADKRHYGQSLANLLFAGGTHLGNGDMKSMVREMERVLKAKGHAHLASWDPNVHLVAILEDGTEIEGERNIDFRKIKLEVPIQGIRLDPGDPRPAAEADVAIRQADIFIYCPGDPWSSKLPIVKILTQSVREMKGKVLAFSNLMTKAGETDGWDALCHVTVFEEMIGRWVDFMAVNTQLGLSRKRLAAYQKEGAEPVELGVLADQNEYQGRRIFGAKMCHIDEKGSLRHNPRAVAKLLKPILAELAGIRA